MRSSRSILLAAAALGAYAAAAAAQGRDWPENYGPQWGDGISRGPQPKRPDPEREAAAEAKRQRKAAKRAADAARAKGAHHE